MLSSNLSRKDNSWLKSLTTITGILATVSTSRRKKLTEKTPRRGKRRSGNSSSRGRALKRPRPVLVNMKKRKPAKKAAKRATWVRRDPQSGRYEKLDVMPERPWTQPRPRPKKDN